MSNRSLTRLLTRISLIVIITLVFISCYGPYFHSWGPGKVCIMFLMAPCGEYFSFSRNTEDTRQCLPQAGQGPARARRSQQRRKWGMLPPKLLNTEALVSSSSGQTLCLIFRQGAASGRLVLCVFIQFYLMRVSEDTTSSDYL